MSDHWEKIDWNWETVELLIRNQSFLEIEWLLNKTVVLNLFHCTNTQVAVPVNNLNHFA